MDLFHIVSLAVGLILGFLLGIWWTRHSEKNHPGKVDRAVDRAQDLRDQARSQYTDRFGPKP